MQNTFPKGPLLLLLPLVVMEEFSENQHRRRENPNFILSSIFDTSVSLNESFLTSESQFLHTHNQYIVVLCLMLPISYQCELNVCVLLYNGG